MATSSSTLLLLAAAALLPLLLSAQTTLCIVSSGDFCNADDTVRSFMPSTRLLVGCTFPLFQCDTSLNCCQSIPLGPMECGGTCVIPVWGWAAAGVAVFILLTLVCCGVARCCRGGGQDARAPSPKLVVVRMDARGGGRRGRKARGARRDVEEDDEGDEDEGRRAPLLRSPPSQQLCAACMAPQSGAGVFCGACGAKLTAGHTSGGPAYGIPDQY